MRGTDLHKKPPARGKAPQWVEVWIEQAVNYGHVELMVGKTFWGFWPDDSADRVKVNGSNANPHDDPHYPSTKGGYFGRLKPRSKTELAYEYANRLWGEELVVGKRVPFYRFKFRVDKSTVRCLRRFMQSMVNKGVEYQAISQGNARNCVSLSIEALKSCRILKKNFALKSRIPKPEELRNVLTTMAGNSPNMKHRTMWLQPPCFS